MQKHCPTLLTIAGSDPFGGAGIQCDIKVAQSEGVYAMAAITAITAQNSHGVAMVEPVSLLQLQIQLDTLLSDIHPDAVKIGMLTDCDQIKCVADMISCHQLKNVVVDTILSPTFGESFVGNKEDFIDCMRERLIPLASVVTPNIPEWEALSGKEFNPRSVDTDLLDSLLGFVCRSLLLKGGHSESGSVLTDYFINSRNPEQILKFSRSKYDTRNLHGTGCFLSSAIASFLAGGMTPEESVRRAGDKLAKAIFIGKDKVWGSGGYGPVSFFDNI